MMIVLVVVVRFDVEEATFGVSGTICGCGLPVVDLIKKNAGAPGIFTIPETTFGEFAAQVKRASGIRAIRCVGDPKAKMSKILVGPGYATPRMIPEVDLVIGGEQQEADGGFDNVEYVMDAASLGMAKGVIMLGHVVSEQAGMEDYANWLRTFVHGVPIRFVPAEEPFW